MRFTFSVGDNTQAVYNQYGARQIELVILNTIFSVVNFLPCVAIEIGCLYIRTCQNVLKIVHISCIVFLEKTFNPATIELNPELAPYGMSNQLDEKHSDND